MKVKFKGNIKKRVLSLFLALALAVLIIPVSNFVVRAADSGDSGGIHWEYDGGGANHYPFKPTAFRVSVRCDA